MGPPGEFSLAAVKTSTPVSVTSKVCSRRILAQFWRRTIHIARTKLSGPFAINGRICPIIRPVNLARCSQGKDGLDRKSHSRFADPYRLVLGIMRYPRRRVEFGINTMTSPCRNNTTIFGLGVCLNGLTKVSERGARFHELNRLFQTLPCRLNYFDRIWVCLGSVANVISFVDVSVVAAVI